MNKKIDIFYFSSTHWDREWYQPFQGYRYRLADMFDKLIKLFETDPEYKTFHIDGQAVMPEDYARIAAAENVEALKKLIRNGNILVGPWYTMPDELNPSGESLIRNLMKGHAAAAEWGADVWKYGYICDMFGHISQMPQLFNGFSIGYALLGRGTYQETPAYFNWRSPDGSTCLCYRLNPYEGYGDFNRLVYNDCDDEAELRKRIKKYIDAELERTEIPVVIIMDGFDHAEANPDTTRFFKIIRELYPDAEIHHENLCNAAEYVKRLKNDFPVITEELLHTSRIENHYLCIPTHTISSYYNLKNANDKCQNILEKTLEPLAVFTKLIGKPLNRRAVSLAYEYLLKNHPHDSICGCSVDQVNKDMEYRYDQIREINDVMLEFYRFGMTGHSKSNCDGTYSLVFTNMLPFAYTRTLHVELPFRKDFPSKYSELFGYESINSFRIYDENGSEIPYRVIDIQSDMKKRYYGNRFHETDIHTVSMEVSVPAFGTSVYTVKASDTPSRYSARIPSGVNYAENDYIRLDINSDGTFNIFDKITEKSYTDLCMLADDSEIGDGWYHVNAVNDSVVYSLSKDAITEKVVDSPTECTFKVTRFFRIPEAEISDLRGKRRSENYTCLKIISYISVFKNSKSVRVHMEFENTAKDHRMRLLLKTGIDSQSYFTGQAFYCAERHVGKSPETDSWFEPTPLEGFTNGILGKRGNNGNGLAFVSSCGLHECSAFDDPDGTISVTLLRSFGTTVLTNGESRCQLNIPLEYDFEILPLDSDTSYSDLLKLQSVISADLIPTFFPVAENKTKSVKDIIKLSGESISLSVIKQSEDEKGIIVRVFNSSDKLSSGVISTSLKLLSVTETNLNEEPGAVLSHTSSSFEFELAPWKIQTYKLVIE